MPESSSKFVVFELIQLHDCSAKLILKESDPYIIKDSKEECIQQIEEKLTPFWSYVILEIYNKRC